MNDMAQDMKYTIRIITLMAVLMMSGVGEAWAQLSTENIKKKILPTEAETAGCDVVVKSVDATTRRVTITVKPTGNYFIKKSDIKVEKLIDPALAPRRATSITEPIDLEDGGPAETVDDADYTFIVPADYTGALVTATFTEKTTASAEVKANDLVYNTEAQELVTTTVEGGTVLYQVDATATDGFAEAIPTRTAVKRGGTDNAVVAYKVYYKIVPNTGFSAPAFDETKDFVEVKIKPAKVTKVTLTETAKQHTGSPLTFDVKEVKAGNLTVPAEGYNVSDNTQTAVGSYQATVTGTGNYEGEVKATFQIVATTVTLVNSNTPATDIMALDGHYILTENVSADVFANLYDATNPFTGTLDGDMYTISGLSHALFNKINGGTVKNVILDGVNISSGTNVGAIANEATGATRIYNCGILSGSVGGTGDVGGLVGKLNNTSNPKEGARVINCFSYAKITGGNNVGGIVGNNTFASTATDIRTMVMNCMFYGDIIGGETVSPVFGGTNIANLNNGGLNTFNYYAYDELKTKAISNNKYNSALAVEQKYLNRFEFYRLLLNSNKKLAAYYASTPNKPVAANDMMKWVLETADRNIENPKLYPVLKRQGYYPSIINIDAESARTEAERNNGGFLGTLSVSISGVGSNAPDGASITTSTLTLQRTDKDFARFNFNYDKVQLPYYNDVGTGNYTGNRVVTGWKITAITPVKNDPYTSANYPTTGIKDFPDHNYADRKSSNKDLYSVSKRVFSQGAYFDVPYGVTSITIEPYWAKAVYIADPNYDVVYKTDYKDGNKQHVTQTGTQLNPSGTTPTTFNGQKAETSIERALTYIADETNGLGGLGPTVYDNALVLMGNLHLATVPQNGTNPFTMMSVDMDNDHEPDYSLIYHHIGRSSITPIRFDFLNIIGTAQAQKPNGASLICNFTIFKTRGWFEVTNTALFYTSQLEYENLDNNTKTDAPLILLGGVVDQFVSTQSKAVTGKTIYIHVGGNVWINEFGMGTHSDGSESTPHVPVSVTGGEFPGFYLTGTYNANAKVRTDNAECYISGGYFHEAAGASLEQIDGDVHWQIYDADIDNFFGGGINDAKPIKGDITTDIYNSHVTLFCGGPKFGNMTSDKNNPANNKKVTTNAEGCTFGKFFGAGYGGTSIAKKKYYDKDGSQDWATLQGYYYTENGGDRGKYFNGTSTGSSQISGKDYGKKGPGVATDFDYEFFVWSSGTTGARLFVKFASFSLAQCNDVESNLTNCTINGDYYGGGSLGKVVGTATSILDNCTVYGNVFGGGFSASLPEIKVRKEGFKKGKDSNNNDIYYFPNYNQNSGMFEPGKFSDEETFTWREAKDDGITLTNDQSGSDLDNNIIYTNQELTGLGQVAHTNLTIRNNTFVQGKIVEGSSIGGVFGGGDESAVNQTTTVNIENEGARTILNVYGGGNKADVGGKTTVNLKDGIVSGDVFGGGRGDDTHAPTVGETEVKLNEPVEEGEGDNKEVTYPHNCVVNGRIFGCNDVSGTPLGNATVHIYKTAGNKSLGITNTPKEDLDNIDDNAHHYHIQAVYGGGNLAAFEPSAANMSTATTHVIIDGCDMTSIKQVYGGGNAASTPATFVEVNGTYEIGEVFGGGNGKDPIGEGKPNPGANVGYKDYAKRNDSGVVMVTDGVVQEKDDAKTPEDRREHYQYGSGEANVRIYGGKIHRVFGGSNTLGNVRNIALTLLDGQEDCDFSVDEAYGGGKSAPMDGAAKLEMACIPGLKAAYGGAEEAEIHNDVTLNITNGTFDRVFGGNNVQGTITGTITVNIEETGCRPIIIGQLYGGGNQAPYRAAAGKTGPTINVRSFTSIGDIFGGGYGKTATVTGDTHVNINVAEGDFVNQDTDEELTGNRTISFQQFMRDDKGDFVYEDENKTIRRTEPKDINLYLPPHAAGEIGGINNVYGGGNEAVVDGNTQVSIGTEKYVLINTIAAGDDLTGKNYYTRSGAGTEESPYVYEKATGTASANTEYYALVKGANIVGNVYGGGNEANVMGSTNVTIGKQAE